ncbi:MAG: exosome complex RNA-binding protein Csl4 [Candidatus Micrarchaeota archaeon]
MILPGEFLAVSEESVGGQGTFEEKDGRIYSAVAGRKAADSRARSVSVQAQVNVRPLAAGDYAYGLVHDLYEMVALVEFSPVSRKGERIASHNNYAYLRISEVQRGYTERFRDWLRIGDVIKARVKEITSLGIYLTIADADLGVVKAFCTQCKHELEPRGRVMVCPACGNKEQRKTPQRF